MSAAAPSIGNGPPPLILKDEEWKLLLQERRAGVTRGISALSQLTVDWERAALASIGKVVNLAATNAYATYGMKTPSTANWETQSEGIVAEKVKQFLDYIVSKVMDHIQANRWVQRAMTVLGWGASVVYGVVSQVLKSKEVIGSLVPVWSTITGALKGGIQVYDTVQVTRSLGHMTTSGQQVASGIPSVAFDAFHTYASVETLKMAGTAVWTFAKTITSLILQVFTGGAAKVFDLIASIAEIVVSFINLLYQAILFDRACSKCRDYVESGEVDPRFESDFADIAAASPILGAFFFGMANYIGHFNLTILFADPARGITPSSLTTAVSSISKVQKTACEFLSRSAFEPKFRSSAGATQYGWLLKMMKGVADGKPRSEILTENASRLDVVKHRGRQGLRHVTGFVRSMI